MCFEDYLFIVERGKGVFYYNGILYILELYYECVEECFDFYF